MLLLETQKTKRQERKKKIKTQTDLKPSVSDIFKNSEIEDEKIYPAAAHKTGNKRAEIP